MPVRRRRSPRVRARIGKPVVATIAVFYHARTRLDVPLEKLVPALQHFLDRHFVPVWGTPAKLVRTREFRKGWWALGFFETERHAAAEGYHDVTPDGLPFARVFLKDTLANHDQISVTASHELAEMLVDPAVNMEVARSERVLYDYEVADPVEADTFLVDGIAMSDFVYPAWFEPFHRPGSTTFDHCKKLRRPFQIRRDGYARRFRGGKWKEVFGSHQKALRFARENRAGHRTTQRQRRNRLERSKPRRPRPRDRAHGTMAASRGRSAWADSTTRWRS